MSNLERWIYGSPLDRIDTFEELKEQVYKRAKEDYIFFPHLLGYVSRFTNEESITENLRDCLFQLLFELVKERKVTILFVDKSSLEAAKWENTEEIKEILNTIKQKLDALGSTPPEVNEIIWLESLD